MDYMHIPAYIPTTPTSLTPTQTPTPFVPTLPTSAPCTTTPTTP